MDSRTRQKRVMVSLSELDKAQLISLGENHNLAPGKIAAMAVARALKRVRAGESLFSQISGDE